MNWFELQDSWKAIAVDIAVPIGVLLFVVIGASVMEWISERQDAAGGWEGDDGTD